MKRRNIAKRRNQEPKGVHKQFAKEIFLNHKLLVYAIYWCILWLILIFYAHVQISTRFICCSCPAFYWFCAEIIAKQTNKYRGNMDSCSFLERMRDIITQRPSPNFIIVFFLLYFSIGTMAFCAFLPFV